MWGETKTQAIPQTLPRFQGALPAGARGGASVSRPLLKLGPRGRGIRNTREREIQSAIQNGRARHHAKNTTAKTTWLTVSKQWGNRCSPHFRRPFREFTLGGHAWIAKTKVTPTCMQKRNLQEEPPPCEPAQTECYHWSRCWKFATGIGTGNGARPRSWC